MKRTFDLCLSALGLALASPVLLIVAALVRVCDGRPVLFRQERVGRGFRSFRLLKFRTMAVEDEGDEALAADAGRVTRLGGFLRNTKLDELPQLWNVLRGDMSLVGPRPELPRWVERFAEEYRTILRVRPGITDPASILYRDEARLLAGSADPEAIYARTILPHKLKLARRYVTRASLGYDVWLLATTMLCLLSPQRALDRLFGPVGRFHHALSAIAHAALVVLAHLAATRVRFEGGVPPHEGALLLGSLPLLVLFRAVALESLGLHERPWRYVDARDVRRIAGAVLFSSVAFWFALTAVFRVDGYSRSVLLLDALFAVLFLAGGRLLARMQHGQVEDYAHGQRALIAGASGAVERTLARVTQDRGRALEITGILDEDAARKGSLIRGVPVLGAPADLARAIETHDPDLVLVEAESLPAETRRQVMLVAARYEKPCTNVTDFERRVAGETRAMGTPDPEVLLPREPIRPDLEGLRASYAGRLVVVTGAGGAVGSELARMVAALEPRRLVLVDRHESSLATVARDVRDAAPSVSVTAALADVTDVERIHAVLRDAAPDVVLHAAASTDETLVAGCPEAAALTNVEGTRRTAGAAVAAGASVFLHVSSDDVVDGQGPLAASRRDAERVVRDLAGRSATRVAAIRFPLTLDDPRGELTRVRAQIAAGGPVSAAGTEAMVLPLLLGEAAHLILEAAARARGGEVFLVDCGRPVRARDLAHAAVLESGLQPGRDIAIVTREARPADRHAPRLCADHDTVWRSSHPRLLTLGEPVSFPPEAAPSLLARVEA